MTTGTLVHDGLTIAVRALPDDITWLTEMLGPSFGRSAHRADVTVAFEEGAKPTAVRDGRREVVFTLDSGPIRLPVYADGRARYAVETDAAVAYRVGRQHASVCFWGDVGAARVRWMRVVREYAHNWSVSTAGVILHGGAMTFGDAAVAIVGPKACGKTTLTARLLATSNTSFLANDRLIVRRDPMRAIAVPTVVQVRAGTLALLPQLARRLRSSRDFHFSAREREHDRRGVVTTSDGGIRVSGAQFAAALERPAVAEAPLAGILHPVSDRGRTWIERLAPELAEEMLAASLVGRRGGTLASNVFALPGQRLPDDAELRSRCRGIAAAVPCFRVSLADNATPTAVAKLLTRCTQAVA